MILGKFFSKDLFEDPKRLLFVFSRYNFADKMIGIDKNILDLGCGEGFGVPFIVPNAKSYLGVDIVPDVINAAKQTWKSDKITFKNEDFMNKKFGDFDAVISLDVIEHIDQETEDIYFSTIVNNLSANGICVLGTPNFASAQYASEASQIGHVNLFDMQRLRTRMNDFFHNVFIFSMNDEVVHTGFAPMSHYLMAVACNPKIGAL